MESLPRVGEIPSTLTLNAPNCYYNSSASSARSTIVSTYGWTITDGGMI